MENDMNHDQKEGKWKQLKGKLREQWGKLTDDELDKARGNAEYLVGRIQEHYGTSREEAMRRIREIEDKE
jgi:uncharacterized protein YjbJ (UPF0337 family)